MGTDIVHRTVAACVRILLFSLTLSLAWAQPVFPAAGTVIQNANLRSGSRTAYAVVCKTVIDASKGERCLCSVAEAESAGWRAARR